MNLSSIIFLPEKKNDSEIELTIDNFEEISLLNHRKTKLSISHLKKIIFFYLPRLLMPSMKKVFQCIPNKFQSENTCNELGEKEKKFFFNRVFMRSLFH